MWTTTRESGFTLVEMLVAFLLAGFMLTVMTGFLRASVATRHDMNLKTESQQGVRALLEMVTQELRQAGACLPPQGPFVALDGADGGAQDSLTIRIGQVNRDTLTCVRGSAAAAVSSGDSAIGVYAGQGSLFDAAALVYITDGANGEFAPVASATDTLITLESGLTRDYPQNSGVYGVDERNYDIDTSSGRPILTMSIDGGTPFPLVEGVDVFNVQYLLAPCDPNCADTVNLPTDSAEWRLVREVLIDATVSTRKKRRDGYADSESGQVLVKPRNLL
ncbi:MAG: PilW family protein [Candidatus Binatia bacterium]